MATIKTRISKKVPIRSSQYSSREFAAEASVEIDSADLEAIKKETTALFATLRSVVDLECEAAAMDDEIGFGRGTQS